MTYRFKLFELGNDLSCQFSKDNLAFTSICFVLLKYEVNWCGLSVKIKKKKVYCFIAWVWLGVFLFFFPPKWDICQGFDLLSLCLCYNLLRGYNIQLFVTLLQGHRIGNMSIIWHCSSETRTIIAISDRLSVYTRFWTSAVRNRYIACLGQRARAITSYAAPVGNGKTCHTSQKL